MKPILVIFAFSLCSVMFQSGWYWQSPKPQGNPLHDVYFTDDTNGWAVGQARKILPWDGEDWTAETSGFEGHLFDVHFINSQKGWAAGQDETVLYTADGGGSTFYLLDFRYEVGFPVEDNKSTIDTVLHSSLSDLEFTLQWKVHAV